MKKLIKISALSICLVLVLSSVTIFTACSGGAGSPTRAARNILNAVSAQNPRRMAAATFAADDSARETLLNNLVTEYENRTPDRADESAWDAYQARRRAFRSISFQDATHDQVGAATPTIRVTVTFTYRIVDNRGDRVQRTATVQLNFRREAGGNWYSEPANRTVIENAVV